MVKHQVVRFRGAASPDDVERVAAEKARQLLPGFRERRVGAAANPMGAGRVADEFLGGFQPSLARGGMQRRSRVIVEVNHTKPWVNSELRKVAVHVFPIQATDERECPVLEHQA